MSCGCLNDGTTLGIEIITCFYELVAEKENTVLSQFSLLLFSYNICRDVSEKTPHSEMIHSAIIAKIWLKLKSCLPPQSTMRKYNWLSIGIGRADPFSLQGQMSKCPKENTYQRCILSSPEMTTKIRNYQGSHSQMC